jgi:hypothetical protein
LLISAVYITGIILPYARDWYFEMGVFAKNEGKEGLKENFGVVGIVCNEEGKELEGSGEPMKRVESMDGLKAI